MTPDESQGAQPNLTDLIQLTTAKTLQEASMIVALLADEEIPAIITGSHAADVYAGLPVFYPRILVPRAMESSALEVLARIRRNQ